MTSTSCISPSHYVGVAPCIEPINDLVLIIQNIEDKRFVLCDAVLLHPTDFKLLEPCNTECRIAITGPTRKCGVYYALPWEGVRVGTIQTNIIHRKNGMLALGYSYSVAPVYDALPTTRMKFKVSSLTREDTEPHIIPTKELMAQKLTQFYARHPFWCGDSLVTMMTGRTADGEKQPLLFTLQNASYIFSTDLEGQHNPSDATFDDTLSHVFCITRWTDIEFDVPEDWLELDE